VHSIELSDEENLVSNVLSLRAIEPEKMPEIIYFREPIQMNANDKLENWLFSLLKGMIQEL